MRIFSKTPEMISIPNVENIGYAKDKEEISIGQLIDDHKLNHLLEEIKNHDLNTYKHSQEVFQIAKYLTSELGDKLTDEQSKSLLISALLHDYGKIKVPAEILNKTEKLTDEEFKEIEIHPEISHQAIMEWGEQKAASIENPEQKKELINITRKAAESALAHHKLQAHPYPKNDLQADLITKLLTAIDSFSAMTDDRRPSNHGNIKKLGEIARELYEKFYWTENREIILESIMILEEYYLNKARTEKKNVRYSNTPRQFT